MPKITVRISDESHRKLKKMAISERISYGKALEKIIEMGQTFDPTEFQEIVKNEIKDSLTTQDFWTSKSGLNALEGIARTYFLLLEVSQKLDPEGHKERIDSSATSTKVFLNKIHSSKGKE